MKTQKTERGAGRAADGRTTTDLVFGVMAHKGPQETPFEVPEPFLVPQMTAEIVKERQRIGVGEPVHGLKQGMAAALLHQRCCAPSEGSGEGTHAPVMRPEDQVQTLLDSRCKPGQGRPGAGS